MSTACLYLKRRQRCFFKDTKCRATHQSLKFLQGPLVFRDELCSCSTGPLRLTASAGTGGGGGDVGGGGGCAMKN